MAGIKDYSTTAANNTTIGSINTAEGMLPSNINNCFRGLGAEIREWYNDSQWVIYGDGDNGFTITYASATSFTISSVDVTSFYHVGRRVKAVGSATGTIYGTIATTTQRMENSTREMASRRAEIERGKTASQKGKTEAEIAQIEANTKTKLLEIQNKYDKEQARLKLEQEQELENELTIL